MVLSAPPAIYVQTAIGYANSSPCQKSKRGAVIFDPDDVNNARDRLPPPIGSGFNGLPGMELCDGSSECRRDCSKRCLHAEARAIQQALHRTNRLWPTPALAGFELVHVKTVEGLLVPSGPPSCWQCCKAVVDVGLEAVWLYEDRTPGSKDASMPTWYRYTADAFHEATLKHEKLHPYDVVRHDTQARLENGLLVGMRCSCGFKPKDEHEMTQHIATQAAAS